MSEKKINKIKTTIGIISLKKKSQEFGEASRKTAKVRKEAKEEGEKGREGKGQEEEEREEEKQGGGGREGRHSYKTKDKRRHPCRCQFKLKY